MSENIYKNLDVSNDFKEYLTSREDMEALPPTTFCHDLVGIVKSCDAQVRQNTKVMNFELKIQDGSDWPMTAWDTNVDRLLDIIVVNDVVHISGVYVKTVNPESRFSKGRSIGFTLQTNSIVTNLTKLFFPNEQGPQRDPNEELPLFDNIQNCVDQTKLNGPKVGLILYVKSAFVQGNPSLTLRLGALSDKHIKITTYIKNYNDTQIVFQVGQKLKVYGNLIEYRGKIALEIENLKEITLIENESCPVQILRDAIKTPQKSKDAERRHPENSQAVKKLKMG